MPPPHSVPLQWTCFGAHVVGFLHLPAKPTTQAVVIVPGGTQTRVGAHRMFVHLADQLADQGIAALRFDIRGRGDSEGDYPGFAQLDADLSAAIAALKQAVPSVRKVTLVGHCDGAAGAAFAIARNREADGLILLNPWARTVETQVVANNANSKRSLFRSDNWKRLFNGQLNIISSLKSLIRSVSSPAYVRIPATGLLADWQYAWQRLSCPTLVVTGSADRSGQEFLALLPSLGPHGNLTLKMIANGTHSFSTVDQTEALAQLLISWLRSTANCAS